MANNVDNFICVQGNEAVMAEWETLFVKYGEKTERPSYHGDGTINVWAYEEIQKHPFMSGYSDDNWYDWGCENVGAKWAHIEDADECQAYIISAWSPIIPYMSKLVQHLQSFDINVVVCCRYEDEFRNFIGVWKDDDYEEIDGEDLTSRFEQEYKVDLSSDEFDWSDEWKESGRCYDELFDELVWAWFEENE